MIFSDFTTQVLKNFASINPSILFTPGKTLKTINATKSVMGIAEIEDVIPSQAGVYDLNRLLSVLGLYKEANIEFGENAFVISEGKKRTNYVYTSPNMILTPPDKTLEIPSEDVRVAVKWDDLQSVLKGASVLQLPEIAFVGADGVVKLQAMDTSVPTADVFGVEIGETEDQFVLPIKTENIAVLPLDYDVTLSARGISKFANERVTYFVAVERKTLSYKRGEDKE